MKLISAAKIYLLIIIILCLYSGILSAQTNFRGKAETVFSYKGDDSKINYYTKDGMVRIEFEPSGNGKKSIFIVKEGSLYMLSPSEKKYTVTPINVRNKLRSFMGDSLNKSVVKSGDTKKILGHNAEKWTYQGRNDRIEIWNTTELGNIIDFSKVTGFESKSRPGWLNDLVSKGFFPLQAVEYDLSSKEIRKFEVKSIDQSELSNDMFEIPKDYRKMSAGK